MSTKQSTHTLLASLIITGCFLLMSVEGQQVETASALAPMGPENDTLGVYIPNAFSPNGDGVNDDFGPYFRRDLVVAAYEFQVFDRWGNQLFISESPADRWSGIYRGKISEPGTYAYTLAVSFAVETRPGQRVLRGKINLVR